MKTTSADIFHTGTVTVNLDAIEANIHRLQSCAPDSLMMAIVKADAYGHGLFPVSLAAIRAGVKWLGVAQLNEALTLRAQLSQRGYSADDIRILSWIVPSECDWSEALRAHIDLSISTVGQLEKVTVAAQHQDIKARIHIKIDTGMSRAGSTLADFPELANAAAKAQARGDIEIMGAWSHLSRADEDSPQGRASTDRHLEIFHAGLHVLSENGITPQIRHLAATSGILWHPDTHFDMVRAGIGMYGLSPDPQRASSEKLGLVPAMTLEAPLSGVKVIEADTPVSYGGTWTAPTRRLLGLVPVGYADGILRSGSNRAYVTVEYAGKQQKAPVVGRICMDQFVVDLGEYIDPDGHHHPKVGDRVVIIGDNAKGQASADSWAVAADTINYEIVTRVGDRLRRQWVGEAATGALSLKN